MVGQQKALQIIEGTWEEIEKKAEAFRGHRVRLILLPEAVNDAAQVTLEEFESGMDELAQLGAHLPPPDPSETYSRETIYADHD